jgi:hypothetical protein
MLLAAMLFLQVEAIVMMATTRDRINTNNIAT